MSKIIEFDTEQTETEDVKKTVIITETKDVIKKVSVEHLQQEIDHLTNMITNLQMKALKFIKNLQTNEDVIKILSKNVKCYSSLNTPPLVNVAKKISGIPF